MSSTPSDDVASVEDALNNITLASWDRIRSSDEINSFLHRRELATAEIEV